MSDDKIRSTRLYAPVDENGVPVVMASESSGDIVDRIRSTRLYFPVVRDDAGNTIPVVKVLGSTPGGTSDHSKLSNRDAVDQHPISAITGLTGSLASKIDSSNGTATGLRLGDGSLAASQDWTDSQINNATKPGQPNAHCTVDTASGNDADALASWGTSTWGTIPFKTIQAAVDFVYEKGRGFVSITVSSGNYGGVRFQGQGPAVVLQAADPANPPKAEKIEAVYGSVAIIKDFIFQNPDANGIDANCVHFAIVELHNCTYSGGRININAGSGGKVFLTGYQHFSTTPANYTCIHCYDGVITIDGDVADVTVAECDYFINVAYGGQVHLNKDLSGQSIPAILSVSVVYLGGEIINDNFLPTKAT